MEIGVEIKRSASAGRAKVGLRVQRLDTNGFLDPDDPSGRTWRDTAPTSLWMGVEATGEYGPEATGTPLAGKSPFEGHFVATVPDDHIPDGVTIRLGWFYASQPGVDPALTVNPIVSPELVKLGSVSDPLEGVKLNIPITITRRQRENVGS